MESFYKALAIFEKPFDISSCANSGLIFHSNIISISLRHYAYIEQSSTLRFFILYIVHFFLDFNELKLVLILANNELNSQVSHN